MVCEWGKFSITMGASKEGTMSVREMINKALRTHAEEDGVDPKAGRDPDFTSESSTAPVLIHKLTMSQMKQMIDTKLMLIKNLTESLANAKKKCESIQEARDELKQKFVKTHEHNKKLELKNQELQEESKRNQVTIRDQTTEIGRLKARLSLESARPPMEPKSRPLTSPSALSKQHQEKDSSSSVPGQLVTFNPLRNEYGDCSISQISRLFPHGRPESPPQLSPKMLTFNSTSQTKSFLGVVDGHDERDFDDELVNLSKNHKKNEPSRFSFLETSGDKSPRASTPHFLDQFSSRFPALSNTERRLERSRDKAPSPSAESPLFDPLPDTDYSSSVAKRMRLMDAPISSDGMNTGLTFRSFSNFGTINADKGNFHSTTNSGQVPSFTNNRNRFLNATRPIPKKNSLLQLSKSAAGSHHELNNSLLEYDSNEFGRTPSGLNFRHNPLVTPLKIGIPPAKRKVGRPPKLTLSKSCLPSTSKSSLAAKPSRVASSSPFTPRTFLPTTTNGVSEQKFSQRGRLLKPNRMRYSPEPEMGFTNKEKCLSFRKSPAPEPLVLPHTEDYAATPAGGGEEENKEEEEVVVPKAVEVPQYRVVEFDGWGEEEDRQPPEDDMSDEAFLKRHLKFEVKEKQRKRWDSQRVREETYNEQLRERQNRKRKQGSRPFGKRKGKGYNSDDEQEKLVPQVDDIKALLLEDPLPKGVFGHEVPYVDSEEFRLTWKPKCCKIDKPVERDKPLALNQPSACSSSSSFYLPSICPKIFPVKRPRLERFDKVWSPEVDKGVLDSLERIKVDKTRSAKADSSITSTKAVNKGAVELTSFSQDSQDSVSSSSDGSNSTRVSGDIEDELTTECSLSCSPPMPACSSPNGSSGPDKVDDTDSNEAASSNIESKQSAVECGDNAEVTSSNASSKSIKLQIPILPRLVPRPIAQSSAESVKPLPRLKRAKSLSASNNFSQSNRN